MTKEIINAVNISLDAYSIIISIIIIGSIVLFKKIDKSVKWFAYTNICAILYGIADIFMWISEGTDAKWKLIALPVSSFIFFLIGIILFVCYIQYIINYYRQTTEINKNYSYICIALALVYIVFLIATPFNDGIYEISEQNTYSRGRLFNVTVGVEALLYMEALLVILKFHKQAQRFENIGFASFIFVPFICQIIQIMNFGIALNSFGLAISFMIIFINLNQKMVHTLEEVKNEFNEKQLKILEFHNSTITYFNNLIETRSIEKPNHQLRLANYVKLLAQECSKNPAYSEKLNEKSINMVVDAIPFHDIGKIFTPDSILKKPGKLTPQEFDEIKKHSVNGEKIIKAIWPENLNKEFHKIVCFITKYHHEKWNGKGYPEQLKGEGIPLCARLTAIADVFDALVTQRCYKEKVSYDEAFEIIKNEAGEHFDPTLVNCFCNIKDKIIEVAEKYNDNLSEGL